MGCNKGQSNRRLYPIGSSRKGQIEIITLLGVLILAIVVITLVYYSLNTSGPANLQQQQKVVRDSVINTVRKGADSALKEIYLHGGYLEGERGPAGSVGFLAGEVSYWQQCSAVFIPVREDLEAKLERGIEDYINENKAGLLSSFSSINVTIGDSQAVVNVLDDRIEVAVTMPTRVKGTPLPQPYKVSVPAKLGRIHDFASQFSSASARERFLEAFTLTTISNSRDIPTNGVLTSCGESVHRTTGELEAALEDAVSYTVTHILWWQAASVNPAGGITYAIQDLNGKTFPDLNARVFLPDRFRVDALRPVFVSNNRFMSVLFPFIIPICATNYDVTYDVTYPAIVRAEDSLTGYTFNFAVLVDIEDNDVGACGGAVSSGGPADCNSLQCSASLGIADALGRPISGATASFGQCLIGTSDVAGKVEGPVMCGENELVIFSDDSREFLAMNVTSESINGTYMLRRKPNITAHFSKVEITNVYGNGDTRPACASASTGAPESTICAFGREDDYAYAIFSGGGAEYPVTNANNGRIPQGCADGTDNSSCLAVDVLEDVYVDYIPAGTYSVEGMAWETADPAVKGAFSAPYTLGEGVSGLYINIPGTTSQVASEALTSCLTNTLQSVCRINPLEESPHVATTIVTGVTCNKLKGIAESCAALRSDMQGLFWTGPLACNDRATCEEECAPGDFSCVVHCNENDVIEALEARCDTRVIRK
ncbi:MAG: hypothetical protein HY367_00115 [Candidatus Aenigmarchaeota archaeon]|nr:hypothetical protein [Candidatus Aenigmarchaeota archaeon]